jgi:ADP-ribosyl-[dinitrogen reductase] hydrolase
MIPNSEKIKATLLGVAIGDALGVPVEFLSRTEIAMLPITKMTGYGSHNQPEGTFSDDSSLTFCLAEALCNGYDLTSIAEHFEQWLYYGYWTPHGNVFDIGIATERAIRRFAQGAPAAQSGNYGEESNGNGSLMRIAPLVFYLIDKSIEERYRITKEVSSITHGHVRSVIACFYYLEFAKQLLEGKEKFQIYQNLKTTVTDYLNSININPEEIKLYHRLLQGNIYEQSEDSIWGTTYVLQSLEASVWSLLITDTYQAAVLKAVNLGNDTDSTGAITGGLAGILYGTQGIPADWLSQLVRRKDIEDLAERMAKRLVV